MKSVRSRIYAQPLFVAAALCISAPLAAQEPAPAGAARDHEVRKGDTLWDLARTYLNDPFMWPCLYEASRNTLRSGNPNLIYPEEHVRVPAICTTARAEGPPPADPVEPLAGPEERTAFYTEPVQRTELPPGVAELPRVSEREFHAAPWIADVNTLPVNGRLLNVIEPHRAADLLPQMAHPKDRMYVEHVGAARPVAGDRLLVFDRQRNVNGWGSIIVPSAIVQVDSVAANVMRVEIAQQFGQVLPGFLTMPLPPVPEQTIGALAEVESGPVGAVLEFLESEPLYGISDVLFVTLGRGNGVEVGDELLAYAPERGRNAESPLQLPPESIARLKVIRVEDRTATARIVSIRHPVIRAGVPVRLNRKVP